MSRDPRGKDLRWTPTSVLRDLRGSWSTFRNSKNMLELMDEEFMENNADQARMFADAIDRNFEAIVELLTQGEATQRQTRRAKE